MKTLKELRLTLAFLSPLLTGVSVGVSIGLSASVASAIVARGPLESGEEYVARLVQKSSSAIGGAYAKCLDPQSVAPSPLALERTAELCRIFTLFGRSDARVEFDDEDTQDPCSLDWIGGRPEWANPETRRQMSLYGTKDAVPKTRAEYLSNYYSVFDGPARDRYLQQVEAVRDRSANACCRADAQCAEAVKSVRITMCTSAADSDATLSDPCTLASASYDLSAAEKSSVRRFARGSRKSAVASGMIVLSPYRRDGQAIASEASVLHEMGHACSMIKRQLAVAKSDRSAQDAAKSLQQQTVSECEANDESQARAYAPVLRNVGAGGEVVSCLVKLARSSKNPMSSTYFEKSCVSQKLEEAAAEAIGLYQSANIGSAYASRICSTQPSNFHPASSDVFKCMLRHDEKIRERALHAFRCEVV